MGFPSRRSNAPVGAVLDPAFCRFTGGERGAEEAPRLGHYVLALVRSLGRVDRRPPPLPTPCPARFVLSS